MTEEVDSVEEPHSKEVPLQWMNSTPECVALHKDAALLFARRPKNTICTYTPSIECYSDASSSWGKHVKKEEVKCSASSDPYVALIEKASEVRQRIHNANEITTRIRDISHYMTTQRVQEQVRVAGLREHLYREFEEEFAAALSIMEEMKFFAILTRDERMVMPVARAAFLSSWANLVRNEASQQMLLSRQLSTSWIRQYQLRKDIALRELPKRRICGGFSASAGHDGGKILSLLEGGHVPFISDDNYKFVLDDGAKLHARLDTLEDLFHRLQKIIVMQWERLSFLQAELGTTVHPRMAVTAKVGLKPNRCSKKCNQSCCSVL